MLASAQLLRLAGVGVALAALVVMSSCGSGASGPGSHGEIYKFSGSTGGLLSCEDVPTKSTFGRQADGVIWEDVGSDDSIDMIASERVVYFNRSLLSQQGSTNEWVYLDLGGPDEEVEFARLTLPGRASPLAFEGGFYVIDDVRQMIKSGESDPVLLDGDGSPKIGWREVDGKLDRVIITQHIDNVETTVLTVDVEELESSSSVGVPVDEQSTAFRDLMAVEVFGSSYMLDSSCRSTVSIRSIVDVMECLQSRDSMEVMGGRRMDELTVREWLDIVPEPSEAASGGWCA